MATSKDPERNCPDELIDLYKVELFLYVSLVSPFHSFLLYPDLVLSILQCS